jgi:hypothetical protein
MLWECWGMGTMWVHRGQCCEEVEIMNRSKDKLSWPEYEWQAGIHVVCS